ncbi:MAG: hypothetical protein ABI779_05325 [Acidobacteriota bacterium]
MVEERRRLEGELGALEKRQAALKQLLDEQNGAVARSKSRIEDLSGDLERRKAETSTYIDQHQLPVACAYASDAASGEGEYSEKSRECARIAAFYCAFAMVNPAFRRKVVAVRQHVDDAEGDAKSMRALISAERQKSKAQETELQATRESLDAMTEEIAALRQRLFVPDGLQNRVAPPESTVSP